MVVLGRGCYTRVVDYGAKGCPATGELDFGPILHGADVRLGVANTSLLLHRMLQHREGCEMRRSWGLDHHPSPPHPRGGTDLLIYDEVS